MDIPPYYLHCFNKDAKYIDITIQTTKINVNLTPRN